MRAQGRGRRGRGAGATHSPSRTGQREKLGRVFTSRRLGPLPQLRAPPTPPLLPPQASLLDREAPRPEVPVYLLTQGTLRGDPAGERTLHPGLGLLVGTEGGGVGAGLGPAGVMVPLLASTFPPVKMGMMSRLFLGLK